MKKTSLKTSNVDTEVRKNLWQMTTVQRQIERRIAVQNVRAVRLHVNVGVGFERRIRRKEVVLFPGMELVLPNFLSELGPIF